MPVVNSVTKQNYNQETMDRQKIFNSIKSATDPVTKLIEDNDKSYGDRINNKVATGAKLTPDEMNYIRKTNPTLYMRVLRVQIQREVLERKLKQCKSKKEVENVYSLALAGISRKDPDGPALIKAYDNTKAEFKKTSQYKALPMDDKNKDKDGHRKKHMESILDRKDDLYLYDSKLRSRIIQNRL